MDHAMWLVGVGTAISNEKVGKCCNMAVAQISLPAHLPDTRQRSRETPASSSA